MSSVIHFLLVADQASTRLIRRLVAQQFPATNIQVGPWWQLVETARRNCAVSWPENPWHHELARCAWRMEDAFWFESLNIAEPETLHILDAHLTTLLTGLGPGKQLSASPVGGLSERGSRHLQHLAQLHRAMNHVLPDALATIHRLLDAPADRIMRPVRVHHLKGYPDLDLWQSALVKKLNATGHAAPLRPGGMSIRNIIMSRLLSRGLSLPKVDNEDQNALGHLGSSLFTNDAQLQTLDDSLQWIGVRDHLEEAEVVAGMVTTLVTTEEIPLNEIAILLPGDPIYANAVDEVFAHAGLPLSGLEMLRLKRDVGRELVHHFLLCCRPPVSAMARASLVESPLMPWDEATGRRFSDIIMRHHSFPEPPQGMNKAGRGMLTLLAKPPRKEEEIIGALITLAGLVSRDRVDRSALETALQTMHTAREWLAEKPKEWEGLLRRTAPIPQPDTETGPLTREGIAVFMEHEEPWRRPRHLFVLGFRAGHYPTDVGSSPLFSDAEFALLKRDLPLKIDTAREAVARRRALFLRQLRAARESITFTVPMRDGMGKAVSPSSSLTFMARLFSRTDDEGTPRAPEELITIMDREEDSGTRIRWLALADMEEPLPPRSPLVADLDLNRNLLELRKNEEGKAAGESPSSLEKLMVSPLAWLLDRSRVVSKEWAPEAFDVAIKGTLAHGVFESLFVKGQDLPTEEDVAQRAPDLIDEVMRLQAPHLLGPQWHVERYHLRQEVTTAAREWSAILTAAKARIVGAEVALEGSFGKHPIHGTADLLVMLPGNILCVVDYKKAKSGKRLERMQKGFDHQTSLYRMMLENGAVRDSDPEMMKEIQKSKKRGILYYMLNDCIALASMPKGFNTSPHHNIQLVDNDVSAAAQQLISQRLHEVSQGIVTLNTEGDKDRIEKTMGIATYALDDSPLVSLFCHPASVQEETP